MREKKAQESILADEYKLSLDYLKQFLPNQDYIQYICFDMAKLNKTYFFSFFFFKYIKMALC